MFLKFIVIAVIENIFIAVTNKNKISTLIIVDIHSMDNAKRKEKSLKTIPKQTSENFISRYFGFD